MSSKRPLTEKEQNIKKPLSLKKNSIRVGSRNLSGLERHGIVYTKFVGISKLGFRLSKITNKSQFSLLMGSLLNRLLPRLESAFLLSCFGCSSGKEENQYGV